MPWRVVKGCKPEVLMLGDLGQPIFSLSGVFLGDTSTATLRFQNAPPPALDVFVETTGVESEKITKKLRLDE